MRKAWARSGNCLHHSRESGIPTACSSAGRDVSCRAPGNSAACRRAVAHRLVGLLPLKFSKGEPTGPAEGSSGSGKCELNWRFPLAWRQDGWQQAACPNHQGSHTTRRSATRLLPEICKPCSVRKLVIRALYLSRKRSPASDRRQGRSARVRQPSNWVRPANPGNPRLWRPSVR